MNWFTWKGVQRRHTSKITPHFSRGRRPSPHLATLVVHLGLQVKGAHTTVGFNNRFLVSWVRSPVIPIWQRSSSSSSGWVTPPCRCHREAMTKAAGHFWHPLLFAGVGDKFLPSGGFLTSVVHSPSFSTLEGKVESGFRQTRDPCFWESPLAPREVEGVGHWKAGSRKRDTQGIGSLSSPSWTRATSKLLANHKSRCS